ncbi:MAG: thioesterase family protein [Elusimicrobia bacterium]|nr:thioesterase family protein [Elusimicrobiota bacterium]
MKNELMIRVPYADTDQMGMVYYSNYLVYFERGRTEWLRNHGLTYRDLEAKGVYIPVIEANCKYISPARYDDEIKVVTKVSDVGPASVEFSYEIFSKDKLITKGKTRHPLVNSSFKPIRLPDEIQKVFEKAL